MIGTSEWPSSSSWKRIAPTRPSIMSLGATASAPASACEIAVRASSSTVMSLSTSPSRTNPQWPCDVYSQRHTSVITTRSGWASLSARTAICTMPSSSYAPEPASSLSAGIPKRSTAPIPEAWISVASATSSEIEKRSIPGIDSTGSRTSEPETTKSGWTRCAGESSVSRTRSRSVSVRRMRRSRVAGKLTLPILGPFAASSRRRDREICHHPTASMTAQTAPRQRRSAGPG